MQTVAQHTNYSRARVDEGVIVATLSHQALPEGVAALPRLESLVAAAGDAKFDVLVQK